MRTCMLHMPRNTYANVRHIFQTECGNRVGTLLCMAPRMKRMFCSSARFFIEFGCRGTNMLCSTPIYASMNCCCHDRIKHMSLLRLPTQKKMLLE